MSSNNDYITAIITILLVSIGLIGIYSATTSAGVEQSGYFFRQLLWAVFGVAVMIEAEHMCMAMRGRRM